MVLLVLPVHSIKSFFKSVNMHQLNCHVYHGLNLGLEGPIAHGSCP